MKSDYLTLFEKRGQSYDNAMRNYPQARDAEFLCLLEHTDITASMRLLDVPSGGGYLAKFVPANVEIHSLEPCRQFTPKLPHLTTDLDLESLNLPANTYDLVICQAAIHHVQNKSAFFAQCYAALKANGLFCIGDISQNNPIATFLDHFAGAHNGTGHNGYYLDQETIRLLATEADFHIVSLDEKSCPWLFDSQIAMLDFCRLLFGLDNVSDAVLLNALEQYVGTSQRDGRVFLHWKMLYCTLQKA